jgi:hypothetical protein
LAAVSLMGLTPPLGQNEDTWIEQSKTHNSAQLVSHSLHSNTSAVFPIFMCLQNFSLARQDALPPG